MDGQQEGKESGLLKRVLIANRGEIAIRIAKAASALGIESVGVYAPADALSLHTRFMTQSLEIHGQNDKAGSPVGSYLDVEALIGAAKASGCDCVHPGYGFLSENADFAKRCAAENLTFIGPTPQGLSLFGDKIRARELARSLEIPVVPGSTHPLTSSDEALPIADDLGYPVMLKASAGGGGRGMRTVDNPEEMDEAFERCQSEAAEAFGDGSVFLEKLIEQPRHIEVQILADSQRNVVHLYERDCSVQLRNQKVIEIAPAPNLDTALRDRLLCDAVKLAKAASYVNAGTMEFLVSPETGGYFFIECNARVQVEHTVTEQVLGIDIVEAQFIIASGGSLASLGLEGQESVGIPRGFAVQARVVARGTGTMTAYKEPSGPGVRVDACGYLGYTLQPQFDPLLAKVTGTSNSASSYTSALDRTFRALDEFHIAGLPTNLPQLKAILSHPDVRIGNARTTLLENAPEIMRPASSADRSNTLALLEQQAKIMGVSTRMSGLVSSGSASESLMPSLKAGAGQQSVVCPMSGTVVSISVNTGDTVSKGDTLFVISAMKMETVIESPCSGSVVAVQPLNVDDSVTTGQVIALITPSEIDTGQIAPPLSQHQTWAPILEEIQVLKNLALARLAPGSDDPGVVRQRSRGKLTCRERIDLLLDDGSFREIGSVAGFATHDEEGNVLAFTPANHVGGRGKIEGRAVIVCGDDFTSRGGHADGSIGAKSGYLDNLALQLRIPSIRMLDGSSGGGSVAAMVPKQKADGESTAKESSGAIKAGRPRVAGGGGSLSTKQSR